jgi:SulP family sulfate permease
MLNGHTGRGGSAALRRRAGRVRIGQLLPFLCWARRLTPRVVSADLMAGLTGAVIVLPQGIAYAFIAGLPPEYGLYTAIVPAVVAALFGSSWHAVTGPTAANSIVVLATISVLALPGSPPYIQAVLALTFLVGVLQLAFGLLRLGGLVNFISDTVVTGFTAGAAVLIAGSQLRHMLGLELAGELSFLATLRAVVEQIGDSNPYAVVISLAAFGVGLGVQSLDRRWPALLIGMLFSSMVAVLLGAERHGVSMVGRLPEGLPAFTVPALSLDDVRTLASGALALAMLGLVQAVSAARAVATRSRQKIDGNQEFIGQGLANMIGSLFSCYASSGSFTRSGANYDAGARTPLAAIVAAAGVLLVLLLAPGVTRYLAMPAMGGIVLLIAWNLIDLKRIRRIVRISRNEGLVLLVTFLATLLLELELAIYAGVLLSLILFLQRTAHPRLVPVAPVPNRPGLPLRNAAKRDLAECPQLKIVRVDGSLFFGAVDHVQSYLHRLSDEGYRYVLLVGSGVDHIDVAAAEMLAQEAQRFHALGGGFYFCSFKDPAADMLRHPAFREAIGADHVLSSAQHAIPAIFARMQRHTCEQCPLAAFGRPASGAGTAVQQAESYGASD